jgi:hypothetical protein
MWYRPQCCRLGSPLARCGGPPPRNARWRAKNAEAYRAYMRRYMAARRAAKPAGPGVRNG